MSDVTATLIEVIDNAIDAGIGMPVAGDRFHFDADSFLIERVTEEGVDNYNVFVIVEGHNPLTVFSASKGGDSRWIEEGPWQQALPETLNDIKASTAAQLGANKAFEEAKLDDGAKRAEAEREAHVAEVATIAEKFRA